MLDYLHRHYTPANLVISVAGNVTHESVVQCAESAFGDLAAGEVTPLDRATWKQTAPRARLIGRRTSRRTSS